MKKRIVKIKKKKKPSIKKIEAPIKPILKKIKPRLGKWCEYYEGRLPSPIECSTNKETPKSCIFVYGEKKIVRDTPKCPSCKRSVKWKDWKEGKWDKVKAEIEKKIDLTDQPSPIIDSEEE